MKLQEARGYAENLRMNRYIYSMATDNPPDNKGTALILLDNRISELEAQLKIKHGLLEDCQKYVNRIIAE